MKNCPSAKRLVYTVLNNPSIQTGFKWVGKAPKNTTIHIVSFNSTSFDINELSCDEVLSKLLSVRPKLYQYSYK